jgi:hypothetical protein
MASCPCGDGAEEARLGLAGDRIEGADAGPRALVVDGLGRERLAALLLAEDDEVLGLLWGELLDAGHVRFLARSRNQMRSAHIGLSFWRQDSCRHTAQRVWPLRRMSRYTSY